MTPMTPEQQAVIDAAKRWCDNKTFSAVFGLDLHAAVDALRAAESAPSAPPADELAPASVSPGDEPASIGLTLIYATKSRKQYLKRSIW